MGANLQGRVAKATSEVAQNEKPMGMEATLVSLQTKFQQAMPRGAEASQLVRDALAVVRQNPKIAECSQPSVLGSLMTCAQLGLRPGIGALGQAHLVPFWNKDLVVQVDEQGRPMRKGGFEAQFIIGYQGMLELANRSNDIEMVVARIVHENDVFDVDYGEDKLVHRPAMNGGGKTIGYYAKFYRKGSSRPTFEWMSVADVEEHRDRFAKQKRKDGTVWGPWVDHFDAMALKTVIRRLFKWMPKSTEIQGALIADETVRLDYENPTADLNHVSKPVGPIEGTVMENSAGLPANVNESTGEVREPEPGVPDEEEMARIYEQERLDEEARQRDY